MEFKFRGVDQQASMHAPQSSTFSYFTDQALRGGYSGPDIRRSWEFGRDPRNIREAIQRELDKERIREEIIASEIARKRLLEEEVRREMSLEREMALAMRFDPRLSLPNHSEGRLLVDRLALPFEERLGYQTHHRFGGTLPFQPNVEPKITPLSTEVEHISEVSNKQAKPEENISRAKRKAVTPAVAAAIELPSVGQKKKPIKDWTCELCEVSALSERGLTEHLNGRKHKARETGRTAQIMGKNYAIGFSPIKDGKSMKLTEMYNYQNLEEEKLQGELLQSNKIVEVGSEEKTNSDTNQNNDLGLQVVQETEASESKNGGLTPVRQKNGDYKKRRFGFWCEMCQVEVHTEKVMNAHKMGKKHVRRLQQFNQTRGAVLANQVDKASQMEEEHEIVTWMKEKKP